MHKMVAIALTAAAFSLVIWVSSTAWVARKAEKELVWKERHDARQADKEKCRAEKRHLCWLLAR